MSTETPEQRLARRTAELTAADPEFAAALPRADVSAAAAAPGLRLPAVVETVLTGYADRPALAQRAVRLVTDEAGRTSTELLSSYDTISYGELWLRIQALIAAWSDGSVHVGDRVAILGFTSVDYTVVDTATTMLGAVSVPLQTSAPAEQLRPIVTETEPVLFAAGVDMLDDAVDLILTGHQPARLVVFDYRPEVTAQREAFEAARRSLAAAGRDVSVDTFAVELERGAGRPAVTAAPATDADPLSLLVYTSGSTGAPKGAMYPESKVADMWKSANSNGFHDQQADAPAITLGFMPMSHVMGRGLLTGTLAAGGTVHFAARSDLSTLLEDLALTRPTELSFVPRIWDMIFQEFISRVDRRTADGADRTAAEDEVLDDLRRNLLGGRFVTALTGSAPLSPEMKAWVERLLAMHLAEVYGSTEAGVVFVDGVVRRPPVVDYTLVDVPDLGYFHTDRPHPRGELLVKSDELFPGYYQRPELSAEMFDADGFYRTGDIVAETGPDRLEYVDRRNNVLKLSQGEFVTVAKVESVFATSALIRQIYIYGNSARSYLLAVVVPTEDALAQHDPTDLKPLITASLQDAAKAAGLQSYEIPRDFLLETEPFTVENGLLTGIRKLARPKLKQHYGDRLEQRYTELTEGQADELRALRRTGADRPVLETIGRAAGALLGASSSDVQPDVHFTDLGGDSLSALTFANLLDQIFGIDVPVGVIVSPANDLQALADYIEAQRTSGGKRPTFAAVHGRPDSVTEVHAGDLTLYEFVDADTLAGAAALSAPTGEVRTVLLTGATGFLGRYLALDWLERMSLVDGKVVCLVRAKDDDAARQRLDQTFDSGDPRLLSHYRQLAADHLEVVAGDKGQANLGLSEQVWRRLAETVDLIVDPAALVNHVLPYSQLFGPNVVGTAELIRLALTDRLKPFTYVSTVGVGAGIEPGTFTEDGDIRELSATRRVDDTYANGYGNSKWAGEVLLREAHQLCGLPVAVFRCDMILADTTYAGQLNLPDMFTRTILSLVATGIAPDSFYERDADGRRRRAHYDGLPVEFIAEAISTLGAQSVAEHGAGFETYHVMNPYDDGIGLDEFVDWLIEAGHPITRIDDYRTWLDRFATAMRGLPQRLRQYSLLPLLHNYQQPEPPMRGSLAPTDRFRAAVRDAKIGPDKDIPHVTAPVIRKYATDLQLLGLL